MTTDQQSAAAVAPFLPTLQNVAGRVGDPPVGSSSAISAITALLMNQLLEDIRHIANRLDRIAGAVDPEAQQAVASADGAQATAAPMVTQPPPDTPPAPANVTKVHVATCIDQCSIDALGNCLSNNLTSWVKEPFERLFADVGDLKKRAASLEIRCTKNEERFNNLLNSSAPKQYIDDKIQTEKDRIADLGKQCQIIARQLHTMHAHPSAKDWKLKEYEPFSFEGLRWPA